MNSDVLKTGYLCSSDSPLHFSFSNTTTLDLNLFAAMFNEPDSAEDASKINGLESVIERRLILNPFLDEDSRSKLIMKSVSKKLYSNKFNEMCLDSYRVRNSLCSLKRLVLKTNSLIDWNRVKEEALFVNCKKFINKCDLYGNSKLLNEKERVSKFLN